MIKLLIAIMIMITTAHGISFGIIASQGDVTFHDGWSSSGEVGLHGKYQIGMGSISEVLNAQVGNGKFAETTSVTKPGGVHGYSFGASKSVENEGPGIASLSTAAIVNGEFSSIQSAIQTDSNIDHGTMNAWATNGYYSDRVKADWHFMTVQGSTEISATKWADLELKNQIEAKA